jgi:hypothetical protein
MRIFFLTSYLFFVFSPMIFVHSKLPIIKANSRNVTVLDGGHYRKGCWYIIPETKPDYYIVENPKKPIKLFSIMVIDRPILFVGNNINKRIFLYTKKFTDQEVAANFDGLLEKPIDLREYPDYENIDVYIIFLKNYFKKKPKQD